MWFIQFFTAYASSTSSTLSPYVTSDFQQHSLTALTTVISSIVGGIWKLPYAKILNIWGRPFGLALGVAIYVVGLILMASCNNVKAYCAAQTFFYVGSNSIDFFITVFIADTSKLKNRALFISYASSPWLITTWIYGYGIRGITANGGIGWRWAFGIFAIIAPIVTSPLIILFVVYEGKARKQGLIAPRPSRGNFVQTVTYYLREFALGRWTLALPPSLQHLLIPGRAVEVASYHLLHRIRCSPSCCIRSVGEVGCPGHLHSMATTKEPNCHLYLHHGWFVVRWLVLLGLILLLSSRRLVRSE